MRIGYLRTRAARQYRRPEICDSNGCQGNTGSGLVTNMTVSLDERCRALICLVEFLQGVVIIFRPEQLPSFDAEGLRYAKRFVRDAPVQPQHVFQFVWGQEVPVGDLATQFFLLRMIA